MKKKTVVMLLISILTFSYLLFNYLNNWRGREFSPLKGEIKQITIIKPGYINKPFHIVDKEYLELFVEQLALRPFYNLTFYSKIIKDADYQINLMTNHGQKYVFYYWLDRNYFSFLGNLYYPYKDISNLIKDKVGVMEKNLFPTEIYYSDDYSDEEKYLIALINRERLNKSLKPLLANLTLTRLARMKSQDMINLNYLGHYSPTFGKYNEMISAAGINYNLVAENIVSIHSADEAFQVILKDKAQRDLILNGNFTKFGVGKIIGGKDGGVFTLLFIEE